MNKEGSLDPAKKEAIEKEAENVDKNKTNRVGKQGCLTFNKKEAEEMQKKLQASNLLKLNNRESNNNSLDDFSIEDSGEENSVINNDQGNNLPENGSDLVDFKNANSALKDDEGDASSSTEEGTEKMSDSDFDGILGKTNKK